MSNTVDALKNLYKTLTGQDYSGEPNPTDAEMIDAIAKDATGGGEETKAYFPLVIDAVSGKVTTSFDDIVDACEKGIPCACEINNVRQAYLGVGTLQSNGGGDARKITFNSFQFSVSGSSRMFMCHEYIISTDGSVTLNQGYIAASDSPV